METEAPAFAGNYPLAGERIGPAWRHLWAALNAKDWINAGDLAKDAAPLFNLKEETIKTILREAHRAGVLDQQMRVAQGRKKVSAHYRVSEQSVRWVA